MEAPALNTRSDRLKKGARIIVATPGRLLDLINRKVVKISGISFVVLDEAYEMLDMGFQEDLDAILSNTPDGRHVMAQLVRNKSPHPNEKNGNKT
jgi:ATP-dependent RNA helicase DeaD